MTQDPNPFGAPLRGPWPVGQSHPADITIGDAPIATFRSTLNARLLECAYDRWHTAYRRKVNPWLLALFVGIAVSLVFYFFIAKGEMEPARSLLSLWMGTGMGLVARFAFFQRKWLGKRTTVQQFRRSTDFETVQTFVFNRNELVTLGPTEVSARRWDGFSSGRRFRDGVLIMPDAYHLHWLPWSDLISGTVDDVDAILKANVADYKEIPT